MYETRLVVSGERIPAYDRDIASWLSSNAGTGFNGLPIVVALVNDADETYRVIEAGGLIDYIGLASMLLKLGLSNTGPGPASDDPFRRL